MDDTTHLKLPYILAAQSQKHVTHNEALRVLDALVQLAVADKDLATPPGSPAEGVRYVVAASPTGAWAGHAGDIAAFQDGAWAFYDPGEGWLAWVADEDELYVFNGTSWIPNPAGGVTGVNPVSLVGVNATADTTDRLSVSSPASLFNHEGAGHQLKINKAAAGNTGSVLFQTGFSGRAEFGLAGDDDFHVKVSADGSAWSEALVINRTNGVVRVTGARERLAANRTYYVRSDGSDSNTGLTNSSGGAFATIQKALDVCTGNLDFAGFTVTISVGAGSFSGQCTVKPCLGQGSDANLLITGAGSGSTTITHSGAFVGTVTTSGVGAAARISAATIVNSNANGICVAATAGGTLRPGADCIFTPGSTGTVLSADGVGALVNPTASFTVSGNCAICYSFANQGRIQMQSITVAYGTRTFTTTAYGAQGGQMVHYNITNSGTVTAKRYDLYALALLETFGGGASAVAGSTAGSTNGNSVYE